MSPALDLVYWELVVRRPWWAPWRRLVECPFCGLRRPLAGFGALPVSEVLTAGGHMCERHEDALAHVLWARYGNRGRKFTRREGTRTWRATRTS